MVMLNNTLQTKSKTDNKIGTHFFSSKMTALAVLASRPVVGSSRNRIVGEMMSSMPMFVRFLSPPETPRMNSFPIYKMIYVCKPITHTHNVVLFASCIVHFS